MSEKVTIKVERKTLHLPTIALRGLVVFPNNLVHFEVGREKSIAAVEWAMANNSNVFLVAQKSMDTTEPQQADLFQGIHRLQMIFPGTERRGILPHIGGNSLRRLPQPYRKQSALKILP